MKGAGAVPLLLSIAIPACSACNGGSEGRRDAEIPETAVADSGAIVPDAWRADTTTGDTRAGFTDAPKPEGGFGPFTGDWGPIPGVPYSCGALLAKDPASSVGPMKWMPCPSGRAGCRKLVVEWTSEVGRDIIRFDRPNPVRLRGGLPYIEYVRLYPHKTSLTTEFAIQVIGPLDSVPTLALGSVSPGCAGATFGELGIAVLGTASEVPTSVIVATSSWSTTQAFSTIFVDESSLLGSPQYFEAADKRLFIETLGPSSVDVLDPSSGSVLLPTPRPKAESPIAVHGGVFAYELTAPTGVLFLGEDGTWADVVTATAPKNVSWVAVDRSAGDALVWYVAKPYGSGYTDLELWTSPYATTAAAAAPRRVAMIDDATARGGADSVANAGVALVAVGDTTASLYRLSDGAHWTIRAEPGDGFVSALWVDEQEVWLTTANITYPDFRGYESGIVRIRRDTLGAPTP
ncbi:MAG: hypothetical protein NVS3B10_03840 [Polyangiales bacterium]